MICADGLGPEHFDGSDSPSSEQVRPWHMVIYEEEEPLLEEALRVLPIRKKKLKPGTLGRSVLPDLIYDEDSRGPEEACEYESHEAGYGAESRSGSSSSWSVTSPVSSRSGEPRQH